MAAVGMPRSKQITEVWLQHNVTVKIELGIRDQSDQKTYAVARVVFGDSYQTAQIDFRREAIQHEWPVYVKPVELGKLGHKRTIEIAPLQGWDFSSEEKRQISEFADRCLQLVKHLSITFDLSDSTRMTMIDRLLMIACRFRFENAEISTSFVVQN